ncbi:unnamed protein product, partial [Rotaria sp. Silwood2]
MLKSKDALSHRLVQSFARVE